MAIKTASEQLAEYLSLSQAAALIPGRPHTSTLARWHKRGVRGTHLRCRRSGNRLYTTSQWIANFLEALNTTEGERLESEGC